MSFDLMRALSSGKALGPHPAFQDRNTPVSTYSPGRAREDAVISQREAMRHSDAYGGAQAIDHVYDCIGLYSDPVSTAPYKLEKEDGTKLVRNLTDGTPDNHEKGPEDFYRLLDKPNPYMLYDELMSLLVIDLLLVGNAYWFKWRQTSDGKPLALYRLAPGYVKIRPDAQGPAGYEYQPPGAKDPLFISPDEILHFRRPNPHSPYYGMGVIQGAGRSMDLELALTDTIAAYYENKAEPSIIVETEKRVPRDVFNKLRAQLRARSSGSHRAGEMLLLEAGLKANTLSRSAADALFEQLAGMSRDRIYTKFRASAKLFGLMDAAGQDKVSDARREFDNSALRPFMSRLEAKVTDGLAAAWGIKFKVDYSYTMPPDEAVKVNAEIAKIPGIKVRELRRLYAQFGIEESTGDPDIDEMVLNMPTPEMDANGQQIDPVTGEVVSSGGLGADQPLGSEPGRPPKAGNTVSIGVATKARGAKALEGAKSLDEVEAALSILALEQKAMNAAGESVSVGNVLPNEQRPDDTFATARTIDINDATTFIMAGLRDASTTLERDLLDTVEGKALKTTDLVSRINRSQAWKTFRQNVEKVLGEGIRRSAASGVMHSNLLPDEELDYDEIVEDILNRPDGVRGIVKTLRDRVVTRIKDTRESDGERADYENAVRAVVTDWSASQAATIAETEAVHGYNEATLVAAEASGVTSVFVTDGDDHDDACAEANGQVWEIGHARENRVEHPRCRRAFLPVGAVA